MSVLSALRACIGSGKQPRTEGDTVHLSPGIELPRKSATAWRYRKGGYLDLASILFLLDNERLQLSQYVKAATDADVQIVPFGERTLLVEYLRGGKHSSEYAEIDQEREQQQEDRQYRKTHPGSGPPSRRGSAPFLNDLPAAKLSPPPSSTTPPPGASPPVRLPRWARWWLLLSSLAMAYDAAFLFLRPRSLPGGSLHRYFQPYQQYTVYDPSYKDVHDPFTHAVGAISAAQIALNAATLLLATLAPQSAWASVLAVATAGATASLTAFFFLFEALSSTTTHRYRLADVSTWDAGYAMGYVATTALWIVFPVAIIATVGGRIARVAARAEKTKKL